ncbi:MAG: MerC domain-containing protein, partial [Candidatus Methylomirabilaceae bacterium]
VMSAGTPPALSRMDRVGASLSLACAIQCMTVPVLLSMLPLAGLQPLMTNAVETLFVIASVGLAMASHCWGFRIHRKRRGFLIIGAAIVMILAGRSLADGPYELALVVCGALLLAAGHLMNRYLCQACVSCEQAEGHGTH